MIPVLGDADRRILDIGCGIGQALVALGDDQCRVLTGVDIDRECLAYGSSHFTGIDYVAATAEALPFQDAQFDLVFARVALPYTRIARSLAEIRRVLDRGGRVWLTLHSPAKVWKHFRQAVRQLAPKDMIFQSYVMANGVALHCLGRQFRFPVNGRCESFQTRAGMTGQLQRCGFRDIEFETGAHFVCRART